MKSEDTPQEVRPKELLWVQEVTRPHMRTDQTPSAVLAQLLVRARAQPTYAPTAASRSAKDALGGDQNPLPCPAGFLLGPEALGLWP